MLISVFEIRMNCEREREHGALSEHCNAKILTHTDLISNIFIQLVQ